MKNYFFVILSVFALIVGVSIRVYIFDKSSAGYPIGLDEEYQFHQLKGYLESEEFPTEGAFFNSPKTYDDEGNARIPGGYFYASYMAKYFIGGKTYEGARLINLITTVLLGAVFLIWIYKRFGIITFAITSALMSVNVYFLKAGNGVYNPHNPLAFSFLFLPILYEYLYNDRKFIYGILLFPILALTAQCHFSNFFSMIPALIIFLILRWNNDTKRNIFSLSIGVFISFLTYLPYLASQFQNNFEGLSKILERKEEVNSMVITQPPQIYSILLFATNEAGNKYAGGLKDILNSFFGDNPIYIYSFIFYVLSIAFASFALIYSCKRFFGKKAILENERKTKTLTDLLSFYMIYVVSSIVFFMLANIGSGRPHYFYSAFTLGFVPIIYFIEEIKLVKPKYINYVCLYAFLNMAAVFIRVI